MEFWVRLCWLWRRGVAEASPPDFTEQALTNLGGFDFLLRWIIHKPVELLIH